MKYFAYDGFCIFRKLQPIFRIGVKTNARNQISIPANEHDMEPMPCSNAIGCCGRCSRMDRKIVKSANLVLAKINAEKFEVDEEAKGDPLKTEIEDIKASLEMMKSVLLSREKNYVEK